jgi:flavin reductase (DIM6/NTAB) family NADH-FMN oxidoreductase RutF
METLWTYPEAFSVSTPLIL